MPGSKLRRTEVPGSTFAPQCDRLQKQRSLFVISNDSDHTLDTRSSAAIALNTGGGTRSSSGLALRSLQPFALAVVRRVPSVSSATTAVGSQRTPLGAIL